MAERESPYLWSTTAASNNTIDPSINFAEGQLPGTLNNSNRSKMAADARFLKDTNGSLTTAGSANAYTLTINGTQTAYATGHILKFKASFANTGAATLNVTNADATAIGAKAIRGPGDVALTAGQMISGGVYEVRYDTAANGAVGAWLLLNPSFDFPLPPPGRITLTTGVGVTSSDVTGATTIYYNAMGGRVLPVYNGSAWYNIDVSTDLSCALDADTGHTGYQQSGKNHDVWGAYVSGTTYFGTGPTWDAGAVAGSNTARGTGAASTEIEWFQGMPVNKNSMVLRHGSASGNTVTVPARQALLLGTIRMTANGVTEDSFAKRFVSNAFNAVPRPMRAVDATSTWAYSTATWRQANAATANQLAYVQTLPGRPLSATVTVMVNSSTGTARLCAAHIGIDSTTAPSNATYNAVQADSAKFLPSFAAYRGFPGIGSHTAVWLEIGAGTDTQTWSGSSSFGTSGIMGETLL